MKPRPMPIDQTGNEPASEAPPSNDVPERRRFLGGRISIRGLLQVALGFGALAVVLGKSDTKGLIEALKVTRISLLPLAIAATVAVTWLMSLRWGLILRVRGYRVPTRRLFSHYLVGIFFSNFVPGGGISMDVARLIYVYRDVPERSFVVSTLVYERFAGLLALLLTGLVATVRSRSYLPAAGRLYAVELLLLGSLILFAALVSNRAAGWMSRIITAVGDRLGTAKLSLAAVHTIEGMSEIRRSKSMIVKTIGLSLLIRVVWSLGCYVVALAMGLPLSLSLTFAFISVYDVIRMFPVSINGLGLREWALVALMSNVGIGTEQAVMFSFLAFAPILLNAILGGAIYISRAGRKVASP